MPTKEDGQWIDGIVRAKWSIDGAKTLAEAADRLTALASELVGLEADGYQLVSPVEDDYGFFDKVA